MIKTGDESYLATFLNDASFKEWVKKGCDKTDSKWGRWEPQNLHEKRAMEMAILIEQGVAFQPSRVPLEKVESELDKLQHAIEEAKLRKKSKIRRIKILRIAAAVLLLLISSFGINHYVTRSSIVEINSEYGQLINHPLVDGSHIVLNANSKLRYNKRKPREIWLDGEAYFEVAKKDKSKERFYVHTKDLTIEVLGTTFNVNSRYEDTEVYLVEGEVKLEFHDPDNDPVLMSPGETINYSKHIAGPPTSKLSSEKIETSWKDGVLVFEDITLKEVLKELNSIYGVSISVENPEMNDDIFNAPIPIKDLDLALVVLEKMSEKKLIKKGETLILIKPEK